MAFEPAALDPRDAPQVPDNSVAGEPSAHNATGQQTDAGSADDNDR